MDVHVGGGGGGGGGGGAVVVSAGPEAVHHPVSLSRLSDNLHNFVSKFLNLPCDG